MNNKYNVFREKMEKLKNPSNRELCEQLIYHAKMFYSYYQQNNKLANVLRHMTNFYDVMPNTEKNGYIVKLKENQLSIITKAILDFYKKLIIKDSKNEHVATKDFLNDWIADYNLGVADILETFRLEQKELGKYKLEVWIKLSCRDAKKYLKTSKSLNLGIEKINKTVRLYDTYKEIKIYSEEDAFNNLFSEAYVSKLVDVMEIEEGLLALWITPINLQIMDTNLEKDRDNISWKECYEKGYRKNFSELKNNIEKVKAFERVFRNYKSITKQLEEIYLELE